MPITAELIAEVVAAAHVKHKTNRGGKNDGYIPALAKVDPQLFGVSCVVTVDGQTLSGRRRQLRVCAGVDLEGFHGRARHGTSRSAVYSTGRWAPIRQVRRSIRCWRWNCTTTSRTRRWSTRGR